jgi:hypothetical protein
MATTPHGDPLVEGRTCGACSVCCEHLTIDEPELEKPAGLLCRHCGVGSGCGIYSSRPPMCQTWFCGWRVVYWLSDAMRPDRSGILIRLTDEVPSGYFKGRGVIFDVLGGCDALLAPEVIEAIEGFVEGNIATYLAVPGLPRQTAARCFLNGIIVAPAGAGDRNAVERVLIDRFIQLTLSAKEQITSPPALDQRTGEVIYSAVGK